MRTTLLFTLMAAAVLTGCHRQKEAGLLIEMTNPTDRYRNHAGIVIDREELNIPDSTLLPVLHDSDGKLILSQLDDIDQDGSWDQLAFISAFTPNETRTVKLDWVTPDRYPAFEDSIKTPNGKEYFKQFTAGGYNLLQEADSIGVGEIAIISDKQTYPAGKPDYILISEGPVRRIFGIDRKETNPASGRIAELVTIWAGHNGYEKEVALINMPENAHLITGIPGNSLSRDTIFRAYEYGYAALMAHTQKSGSSYTGMAIIIPKAYYTGRGYTTFGSRKLWYAGLKPDTENKLHFYVYGAKESDDTGFRSSDYFEEYIDYETLYIDSPIEVDIIN